MFLEKEDQKTETEKANQENLVAFFDLLLKIDMRVNPDLYKPNPENYD